MIKESNNSVRIDDGACKLSTNEKRKILHQYTGNIKFTEDETEEILRTYAYFPLLCKMFSNKPKNKDTGVSFFRKPFENVREEIEMYKDRDTSKYSALISLVVSNNNMNVENMADLRNSHFPDENLKDIPKMGGLPDNTPITSMTKGFEALEGFFVRRVGNSYKFIHDFVQEITAVVIGARCPKQTIKYADNGFLRRRVKIEDGKQECGPLTVYLPDGYIDDLVQRFLLDIQTEHLLDVVLNPCLRNKLVIESFIKHLEEENDVSLDLKRTLVEVDAYELGKVKENSTISRLGFFLTQGEVTPLSALIIFCHDEIALYCLKNFAPSDEFSTFASICANGNTVLYDVYSQKYAVKYSNVIWGGFYALHMASLFHNLEMTKTLVLIHDTGSMNIFDGHGLSPLMCAVLNGEETESFTVRDSRATVQYLLDNGADINLRHETGASPLYMACENGHYNTVQLLLNNGADINLCTKNGSSPLHVACYNGHDRTVQLLLNNGTDINLYDNDGASPIYIACENGHGSMVQLLLNNGADINSYKKNEVSLLYTACENGHDSTVKLLLNNGADINLCKKNGSSPLHAACYDGHDNTVQLLLNNGGDIDLFNNNGFSPLHVACQNRYVGTVQLLLNNGANINLCENNSVSPLYITCYNGDDSMVQLLLNKGADINSSEKNSASPLYIACYNRHDSTVKLLLSNGANDNPLHVARG
ncbi:ankyrin-1-like [Ostrea edulis]|uniref:ankyrin-1-like n=1 Tax=Ostrea edulis TaxID=37623 RepID=UPI0024AF698E|nr:ankyrin-1-like [Ostrea edulis]